MAKDNIFIRFLRARRCVKPHARHDDELAVLPVFILQAEDSMRAERERARRRTMRKNSNVLKMAVVAGLFGLSLAVTPALARDGSGGDGATHC
ncbi:MAG: hypothetical protein KGL56_13755, partial [Alphaproteobacteria bacterium]|nr:hypothetical protein [Alphaproteobacteria bacterium]